MLDFTPDQLAFFALAILGPSGIFAKLRSGDRKRAGTQEVKLQLAHTKIVTLEDGEKQCRVSLNNLRDNFDKREVEWRKERNAFQDEISRQERERYKLTFELNALLVEKVERLHPQPPAKRAG